jgi:hypothetical protein
VARYAQERPSHGPTPPPAPTPSPRLRLDQPQASRPSPGAGRPFKPSPARRRPPLRVRISGLVYEETRGVLKVFEENALRDSITYKLSVTALPTQSITYTETALPTWITLRAQGCLSRYRSSARGVIKDAVPHRAHGRVWRACTFFAPRMSADCNLPTPYMAIHAAFLCRRSGISPRVVADGLAQHEL